MRPAPLSVSLTTARRLTVTKQHLAGRLTGRADSAAVLAVVRDLAYVQWDPVTVVAPSHLLSLWSRAGSLRPEVLERLLWREKKLFEHWLPFAALVLTEDYPLYRSLMERYPASMGRSWGRQREEARRFLRAHGGLRTKILKELRSGPHKLGDFEDHSRTRRNDGDWGSGSDVALMLFHLTMTGDVMVVGHEGNQNLWGLAGPFLPNWVDRTELSATEFERAAAQRAIRALGTATPREIHLHFVRGRYDRLRETLANLEDESEIYRVTIEGLDEREERFVHARDLPLLDSLAAGPFEPRLSLLPPFDNLVHDPGRLHRLFGFQYVREQFLPKEKRKYGTYVLPILWGENLIGRIDPRLDKERRVLVINAVHAEPGAPRDRDVAERIAEAITLLAQRVGAREVSYGSRVPDV